MLIIRKVFTETELLFVNHFWLTSEDPCLRPTEQAMLMTTLKMSSALSSGSTPDRTRDGKPEWLTLETET